MDDYPYELSTALKSVECLILPINIGFIIGMFKGIEINHPGLAHVLLLCHFRSLSILMDMGKYSSLYTLKLEMNGWQNGMCDSQT